MLLLGIQMSETQADSFFALSGGEKQSVKIERIRNQIEPIYCILKPEFWYLAGMAEETSAGINWATIFLLQE